MVRAVPATADRATAVAVAAPTSTIAETVESVLPALCILNGPTRRRHQPAPSASTRIPSPQATRRPCAGHLQTLPPFIYRTSAGSVLPAQQASRQIRRRPMRVRFPQAVQATRKPTLALAPTPPPHRGRPPSR